MKGWCCVHLCKQGCDVRLETVGLPLWVSQLWADGCFCSSEHSSTGFPAEPRLGSVALSFSRMVPCPVLCAVCEGHSSLPLHPLPIVRHLQAIQRCVSSHQESEAGGQVRVPPHRPLLGFLSLQGRGLEDTNPRSPASEYCWWCGEAAGFLRLEGSLAAGGLS